MTRQMTVESITQDKSGTIYELRTVNQLSHPDDRLTLVIKMSDEEPGWKIGESVMVTIGGAA